jgi:hypothetical protein
MMHAIQDHSFQGGAIAVTSFIVSLLVQSEPLLHVLALVVTIISGSISIAVAFHRHMKKFK